MNAKVSVIVPVYNTSRYIEKCCRSLFGQTLDSIQYIFVDDGSDDDSIETVKRVLSDYPQRSTQVTFVNLPTNKGVGSARRAGVEHATGDYIIHCDSDDWVESDAYQLMVEKATDSEADVVTCGYSIDTELGDIKKVVPAYVKDVNLTFDIGPQTGSLFLKLIRREFIVQNRLQVPENIDWGEDLCMSLEALLLCNKVVSVGKPLYHYVQHVDSVTHTVTKEKCLSLVKCGHIVEEFLKDNNLENRYSFQLNWLKFQLKQYLLVFPQTRDLELWKSFYPECHSDILRYNTMTYLKAAAWLIIHRMGTVAILLLKLRDRLSALKNR